MSRDQRIILVVFLILLSSGAFGAATNNWMGMIMLAAMGLAFRFLGSGDGNE